jgi:hypothetical protein
MLIPALNSCAPSDFSTEYKPRKNIIYEYYQGMDNKHWGHVTSVVNVCIPVEGLGYILHILQPSCITVISSHLWEVYYLIKKKMSKGSNTYNHDDSCQLVLSKWQEVLLSYPLQIVIKISKCLGLNKLLENQNPEFCGREKVYHSPSHS